MSKSILSRFEQFILCLKFHASNFISILFNEYLVALPFLLTFQFLNITRVFLASVNLKHFDFNRLVLYKHSQNIIRNRRPSGNQSGFSLSWSKPSWNLKSLSQSLVSRLRMKNMVRLCRSQTFYTIKKTKQKKQLHLFLLLLSIFVLN